MLADAAPGVLLTTDMDDVDGFPHFLWNNKLCALLGRAEIRDLVDVRALEGMGLSLERGLLAGHQKDGGLTPGQLAWVLSQISIGEQAPIPGGGTVDSLRAYLRALIDRLARLAHPGAPA
jgi:hypothetical protein